MLGLALALVVAIAVAVLIHLIPPVRAAVLPLLAASQAVPIVLLAPLLVAWFGFDILPKAIIVAIVTFFPIAVTTLDGLESVDPGLRKLLRTFGASRWHTLRLVEAPAALPGALSGAKIAVAVAVIGAVLAEEAGTSSGLGLVITQSIPQLDTARAFAATVVLTVLAAGAVRCARPRRAPARPLGRARPQPRRNPHVRRLIAAWLALAAVLVPRRLRREVRAHARRPAGPERVDLVLDYVPNPDHAGHLRRAEGRASSARRASTSTRSCRPTRPRR